VEGTPRSASRPISFGRGQFLYDHVHVLSPQRSVPCRFEHTGRVCAIAVRGTRPKPLVVVYVLGVLAAAVLVLMLLLLLVSRLANTAVTPSSRSACDLEASDLEAASLRTEGLEVGEASGPTRKDVTKRASQQERVGTQRR
jgi:hypothetical protein